MSKEISRRTFLATGLATGALAGAGGGLVGPGSFLTHGLGEGPKPGEGSPARALKILILGGTSFLGPHQIRYALERGHEISIFTRGRTRPVMFPEVFTRVEHLVGDRGSDLEVLRGRSWDVVIDNSCQNVQWARSSARLLADASEHYLFVSSTGVFFPYLSAGLTEEDQPPLVDAPPRDPPSYGVMKTLSEREVQAAFGDRAIIVRPKRS